MKLSNFRSFLVFVCSVGLVSYVVGSPGQSGDHGRPTTGPGSSNGNGPGFSQDSNPGQQGQSASDGTRFDSQDNPGNTGSAFGRDKASGGLSTGSSSANGRGESVSETSDRTFGESSSNEKSSSNSGDSTFKGSLMDSGLKSNGALAARGTPGQPPSGTPPGKHLGWEKGKHNPHRSPSPTASASASASASPSATASASASPSATATATAAATATATGTP